MARVLGRRWFYGLLAPAALALLAGCGSSGGGGATSTGSNRYFGDHPGQRETAAHIGKGDCLALSHTVGRQLGTKSIVARSEPTPPNSRCRLLAKGARVTVSLDAAYAARQRYENRMVEQVQFNAPHPAKVPHHLRGVGDPSSGEHFASWIPAYSSLFAVRGNRWLTINYSVAGETRPRRKGQAAALARRAFSLTAH